LASTKSLLTVTERRLEEAQIRIRYLEIQINQGQLVAEPVWRFPKALFDSKLWQDKGEYEEVEMTPLHKQGFDELIIWLSSSGKNILQTILILSPRLLLLGITNSNKYGKERLQACKLNLNLQHLKMQGGTLKLIYHKDNW